VQVAGDDADQAVLVVDASGPGVEVLELFGFADAVVGVLAGDVVDEAVDAAEQGAVAGLPGAVVLDLSAEPSTSHRQGG